MTPRSAHSVDTASLHFGILQCDSVRPSLRNRFGDYPDMFRTLVTSVLPQARFTVHDLPNRDFPEHIDECDAWLITGSKSSVHDSDAWIERAHDLVRDLHADRRTVIGICFGHQLISRALGGRVERASVGWGAGLHGCRILERQPWMQPAREELSLLASHQDQVVEPPPQAMHLAGHDFCPFDMLQVGDHILTFQGHPEFEPGYARALIELRRDQIGPARADAALASLERPADAGTAASWIACFIEHARGGTAATMRRPHSSPEDST